jgi:predicted dehydrogenase
MGRTHARGYIACPDAELAAVCDIDPTRLEERSLELGVKKAYLRYREMFEKEHLDAVSVAVPNDLHCPITCDALNAGLHVLCEKPMARTAREARKMCDVAKRRKRRLMIHFNYRWSPQARVLKDFVDAGELGQIYYARTRWLRSRGFPGLGTWFTDRKRSGGGPLIDLGVHRIDFALWLMGFPRVATVSGSTYDRLSKKMARRSKKVVTIEDLACALIRFENGATLMVEASWDLNGERLEDQLTELYGTSGGLVQRNIDDKYEYEVRFFKEVNGKLATVIPREVPRTVESTQAHFVGCILNDTQPASTGEHGLYIMKILDAIYESAAKGREVKVS